MRAVGQPDRTRGAADLLHRDDVREVAHPGAAMALVDGDTQQAELAERRPQVAWKLVVAVDLGGPRRDPVAGKTAHRFTQQIDVLALAKIEFEHIADRCRR